ncbi:MAG: mechanosensitive ion channel family protein [Candidatus Cybelea sp.]
MSQLSVVAAGRRAIVFAAALACALAGSFRACPAQVPFPIPVASESTSPYGVQIKRVREFDTAPISYAGKRLFDLAALPATANDAVPPIVLRVETVEENLRLILPPPETIFEVPASRFDAATFSVEIGKQNGYPILYATDAKGTQVAPIVTVTEADASAHGVTAEQLAEVWRNILQQTLAPAVQAAAPEHVAGELRKAPYVLLVAVALTCLMLWVRIRLRRRSDMLQAQEAEVGARDEGDAARLRLRRRRQVVEGASWLLTWGTVLLWLLVALWILTVVPATRGPATTLSRRIAVTAGLWFVIVVFNYLSRLALVELGDAWGFNPFLSAEDAARKALRRPMIVVAIDDLKGVVLYLIGVIATLSIFEISPASVLTIGAIIALVIGFAAQSVVRDYVGGFLILVEDQYAVGDQVTINGINGVTGAVESLTLRITQVRTDTGALVTLPNGTITIVENATRTWSRIDFRIAIALDSDVERALALLRGVVDGFAAEDRWRPTVLEPPQVLGVESMTADGIVLRAWVKVRPTERRPALLELNRRVIEAFRSAGVAIAVPMTRLLAPNK